MKLSNVLYEIVTSNSVINKARYKINNVYKSIIKTKLKTNYILFKFLISCNNTNFSNIIINRNIINNYKSNYLNNNIF